LKTSFAITRGLSAAALFGLMILAVLGFRAQEQDMRSLRSSSQEIIYWSTSQAEAELARFVAILGRFALGDPTVSERDVNDRFNILWSRVELFRTGDVGRRVRVYDAETNVIPEMFDLLREHESAVVNISRDDPSGVIHRVLQEFSAAGERLRRLSVEVLAGEERRLADARDAVRLSARLTWIFSMSALLLSMLVIGIMLIETRRYRRMAFESTELAARAEAASQAKSRFLTMMSHELRTPMNGVLGLLALVRQTALNERQIRLIDQAERSGRQMSGLLGDILDYSDLQSETLVMARETFELGALARSVEENFGPAVQRAGVKFRVAIDPAAPRWVIGDFARLRQVLGHFITFLVDVVGSEDVTLAIGQAPDAGRRADPQGSGSAGSGVRFEICVDVRDAGSPGWQPEAMFDKGAEYGNFASDALGPMIARGLVSLMGGTVTLERPQEGRAKLIVTAPLEVIGGAAGRVRVEAQTATVQMVLLALLKRLAWTVWEPGAVNGKVAAALMEAGGEEEATRAARLRADHPSARLIAIGTPRAAALFDAVCATPLTEEVLFAALGGPAGPASLAC